MTMYPKIKRCLYQSPESRNGFKLSDKDIIVIDNKLYYYYITIWSKKENSMTFEEFEKLCDFCSDWKKMDEHGECFGGFWNYPEGSYERENAGKLSYQKNIKCLWNLPWPKHFIIYTVKRGCNDRMESVRYSNEFCEMMYRSIIYYDMTFMTRILSSDIITKILEY